MDLFINDYVGELIEWMKVISEDSFDSDGIETLTSIMT